jgi:hypothetical protein
MSTPNEIMDTIKSKYKEIDEYDITHNNFYMIFRKMKIRRITDKTKRLLKMCVAIHESKLVITTNLLANLITSDVRPFKFKQRSVCAILHTLGDKRCVLLIRSNMKLKYMRWIVNADFMDLYRKSINSPSSSS